MDPIDGIGGDILFHNSQPDPEDSKVRSIIRAAKGVATSAEKRRAFFEVVESIQIIAFEIFDSLKEKAEKVHTGISGVIQVLGLASLAAHVHWWLYEKAQSISERVSMVFLTSFRGLKSLLFFEECGAFNLSKFFSTVGKVPVIGIVVNCLLVVGFAFHTHNTIQQYKIVAAEQGEISELIDGKRSQAHRDNEIVLNKIKLELANDITNFALGALTLIGFASGWGALAAAGVIMLVLGSGASGLFLYTCYYSSKHDKVKPITYEGYMSGEGWTNWGEMLRTQNG